MLETDKIHFLVLYDLKIHFKTILRINLFYIFFSLIFLYLSFLSRYTLPSQNHANSNIRTKWTQLALNNMDPSTT
jgi:hypothetical protein